MVRYRRNFVPGGTFFFTVTLADRSASTLVTHIGLLRSAMASARKQRPFDIDAIVVLPDHLHAVFTLPEGDQDFPGRWRSIKSAFTMAAVANGANARQDRRGEYNIWQKRYWEHTIRDDRDFARHADYIHFNPVKHGITTTVADWPFSSFHTYVRQGRLPAAWGGTSIKSQSGFGEP